MPTFYNYTENGVVYSFDDVFVPANAFRQGNIWGWGDNSYGQLGNNSTLLRSTPVTTFSGGVNWKQISSGQGSVAAIKTDGTLWNWGTNYYGNLGNNVSGVDRSTPLTTFAGGTNWKQVACGNRHAAAIKTDGTLWLWGENNNGELGINIVTSVRRCTPVTTFAGGTNWKQVACGFLYTAAIKTDGTLWVWGYNLGAQLGDNTIIGKSTPVTTFAGGTNWKQVSASSGSYHTAAIKTDGTLWIWGSNYNGQCGVNNSTTYISTPVTTFAGGNNWKQVSVGRGQSAAIKTDGTLWTWGANSNNQRGSIGNNTAGTNISTPVTTFAGGTNWKQVSCGYGHKIAVKTDGTLWGWGADYNFQLGTNAYAMWRCTPVTTFAGGTNWKQVDCGGYYFSAALTYFDDYV